MRKHLSITHVGLLASAVLAVLYVIVMLASILLVSRLTTGSWQAAFLDIGWNTIAGFEIGFLGVGITAFAVAAVFVPIYNRLQRLIMPESKTLARTSQFDRPSAKSWEFRLLAACLLFPALTLLALHALVSAGALGAAYEDSEAPSQSPGSQRPPVTLSPVINTAYREAEPSFTADGRTMYFNCNNGDICVSHLSGTWEQGSWTTPERLSQPVNTGYEEVEPIINADGDKLYFTSRRPGDRFWGIPFFSPFLDVFRIANTLATAKFGRSLLGGLGLSDVYVSYRVNGAWSEPQNLNDVPNEPTVNTGFDDHCLFFSADGNQAFWTSTRPGGFGDDDIWTSRRVGGVWTQPENLGPNVNGPGSEHTSIPTPDGRSLYVTTATAKGFGKEDIYVTTAGSDGRWGPLVNLGPLVNGSGDDRCPAWTPDLRIFLFDSIREGGFGARDIWWVYFKEVVGYPLAGNAGSAGRISTISSRTRSQAGNLTKE